MQTHRYDPSKLSGYHAYAFQRYGGLTQAELDELMAEPSAESKMPDITRMVEAFKIAATKGSKQPQARVKGFIFKLATRGATPGAVFVMRDENIAYLDYLGKFWQGKFVGSNKLRSGEQERILKAAANPLDAIVAFGRQTGKCGICNRTLTDPTSIGNGIGPICQDRFGL